MPVGNIIRYGSGRSLNTKGFSTKSIKKYSWTWYFNLMSQDIRKVSNYSSCIVHVYYIEKQMCLSLTLYFKYSVHVPWYYIVTSQR
jgi:hypothetical protein